MPQICCVIKVEEDIGYIAYKGALNRYYNLPYFINREVYGFKENIFEWCFQLFRNSKGYLLFHR